MTSRAKSQGGRRVGFSPPNGKFSSDGLKPTLQSEACTHDIQSTYLIRIS